MKIDNEFTVSNFDIDNFTYPKAEVNVWSKLFGSGGSVDVEAMVGNRRVKLYSIEVEEKRNVSDEREECQAMADE